jgi:hypothetical protein
VAIALLLALCLFTMVITAVVGLLWCYNHEDIIGAIFVILTAVFGLARCLAIPM